MPNSAGLALVITYAAKLLRLAKIITCATRNSSWPASIDYITIGPMLGRMTLHRVGESDRIEIFNSSPSAQDEGVPQEKRTMVERSFQEKKMSRRLEVVIASSSHASPFSA